MKSLEKTWKAIDSAPLIEFTIAWGQNVTPPHKNGSAPATSKIEQKSLSYGLKQTTIAAGI